PIRTAPISVLELNPATRWRRKSALLASSSSRDGCQGTKQRIFCSSIRELVERRGSAGGRAPMLLFTVLRRSLAAPVTLRNAPRHQESNWALTPNTEAVPDLRSV